MRQVLDAVHDPLAYTTIATVLDRLHDKGRVQRSKHGVAWRYRASRSREEAIAAEVGRVLQRAEGAPEALFVAFLDHVEQVGPEALDASRPSSARAEVGRERPGARGGDARAAPGPPRPRLCHRHLTRPRAADLARGAPPMRVWICIAVLASCGEAPEPHGHAHGPQGEHVEAQPSWPVAITRWTDAHELFIQLDAPVAGQRFAHRAHVTRLADNHAVTTGSPHRALRERRVRRGVPHRRPDRSTRHLQRRRRRPVRGRGVRSKLGLHHGDSPSEWNGGTLTVGADAPVPHASTDSG